ncbi:MAG: hypothetical protein SFX73_14620 [Kofleriaceae bacterium]|nr:hypothetical protein [Kofleriaceae bacterium]
MATTDAAAQAKPRPYLAIPAALLVLIAVWEIIVTLRSAHSVPADDAWISAAKVVRAGYKPGDLIVFAPAWADPIGRMHLGDLISIDDAARMDAAKYGRIWEVSMRGAQAPEVAGLTPAESASGEVTVRRFERTPVTVLADIRDLVATARTEGAARTPSLELAEVGFAPHRCLQVIPNVSARITFPNMPLGSELVGYVGIADVFTRRDVRVPATLAVEIGGKQVASVIAGVEDGWVRFAAPTTPGPADVTFVVGAKAPMRQVCFAAEART